MHIVIGFPIEQAHDFISGRKAFAFMRVVIEYPLMQVASYPDIQSSGQAAHDVRVIASAFSHGVGVLRLRIASLRETMLRSA